MKIGICARLIQIRGEVEGKKIGTVKRAGKRAGAAHRPSVGGFRHVAIGRGIAGREVAIRLRGVSPSLIARARQARTAERPAIITPSQSAGFALSPHCDHLLVSPSVALTTPRSSRSGEALIECRCEACSSCSPSVPFASWLSLLRTSFVRRRVLLQAHDRVGLVHLNEVADLAGFIALESSPPAAAFLRPAQACAGPSSPGNRHRRSSPPSRPNSSAVLVAFACFSAFSARVRAFLQLRGRGVGGGKNGDRLESVGISGC